MGACVRARDREPQPAADAVLAPREPVEEAWKELLGDTEPCVRDRDPEKSVPALGREPDRRRAVAGGVVQQIRDHSVEDAGIRDRGQPLRDLDHDRRAVRERVAGDLLEHLPDGERLCVDPDPLPIEL